jgi:DNA polymerase III epsilon subunit-like protein
VKIEEQIPGLEYPGVLQLAKLAGVPISVFDLETTTFRGCANFGITEVAIASVYPNGASSIAAELINPQAPIDRKVVTLTGITQKMVQPQPTWGQRFATFFHEIAETRIISGFNCATFDCYAVVDMNVKYGVPGTSFSRILDTRTVSSALGGIKGKLIDVAKHHGILPRGNTHRALADTVLTLELLNAQVLAYGADAVLACIKPSKL